MTLLVWKRKNNNNIIHQNQIKGIIAIFVIMAVVPFFNSFYLIYFNYQPPDYSKQSTDSIAVEITKNDQVHGIYFLEPGTSAKKLLQVAHFKLLSDKDFYLENGEKINIDLKSAQNEFSVSEMDAAKKLALGIPLDINKVNKDDLILIKGIGEKTAINIIELREKKGRFNKVEELTQIRGIKEKKLSEFKKYLYVREAVE